MKKINNILIIIPSLTGGGAEKIAANLACLFDENNFSVEIICIYKKNKYEYHTNNNIKLNYLNCKKISTSIFKLRKVLKDRNDSFVISFLSLTNIFLSLSKILLKKKHIYIYTQHEIPSKTFNRFFKLSKSFLIKLLIKIVYKNADKIVCVSKGLEGEMKKLFSRKLDHKITTIYNYIRPEKENKYLLHKRSKSLRILSIGRLVDHKDFQTLLEAINLIKNKIDIKLTIIGEGHLEFDLKNFIVINKLENICKILPFTKNLSHYFNNSDIYISTSLHESFGNTLVEAMLYELKIISTNCIYGPGEILQGGEFGKLIPTKSPNELASSILLISKTKSTPNYEKIIKKFQEKSILNAYKSLFKELISSKF